MHHFGVLMVGMNPSSAQLASEQVRLHCMNVLKGARMSSFGGDLVLRVQ